MRALLLTALLLVIFFRCYNTEPIHIFQIAYRQTEKRSNDSGLTCSLTLTTDFAMPILSIGNREYCFSVIHAASEKDKRATTGTGHTNASSGPAELTLEYMAVQLTRSHSFR